MKKPKLEDFYDELDPRGCSTSEYNEYLKALDKYDKSKSKNQIVIIPTVVDIEGNKLEVGDDVYYARARYKKAILVKCKISKIHPSGNISMGVYRAFRPSHQLIKIFYYGG